MNLILLSAYPLDSSMQCFISYAHHDYSEFGRMEKHLSHIAHAFGITLWSDKRIAAGYYWSAKIEAEIFRSDIVVLLVTNDFLGSDYIFDHELPAIIQKHKNDQTL